VQCLADGAESDERRALRGGQHLADPVAADPVQHDLVGAGLAPGLGGPDHVGEQRVDVGLLGEIPLRKFAASSNGKLVDDQPIDPDGNPDTSFLAKIPADQPFPFQTLNKEGMVLNMAQTWHQLRPGEVRHNCGGCPAHSQKPPRFEDSLDKAKSRFAGICSDLGLDTPEELKQ